MKIIRLGIHGAAGRMGQRLVALAVKDKQFHLAAAVDSVNSPHFDEDAGLVAGVKRLDLPIKSHFEKSDDLDVVIDFSTPEGTDSLLNFCVDHEVPLVFATTGLSAVQVQILRAAGEKIPLLWSPSMSMSVILAMRLSQFAGKALADKDADVEIIEHHHRFKEDAPSGTALKFGQIIADEMGLENAVHGREGRCGMRSHNEIGYHAVRIGDNPGQHTILFGMLGETLEITVKASNRDCYALGAFAAAKFLIDKPAKLYDMNDVLGI
ncbi:MAG: 4-hydroxy-tetrahydrodipicolinate reductase [Thermoguttaceae bacterium]